MDEGDFFFSVANCPEIKNQTLSVLRRGVPKMLAFAFGLDLHGGSNYYTPAENVLGNYFSGFQVMITCAIICQKCSGNYFSAISGNLNFYYLFRICFLPETSPKFENCLGGGNFPLYKPSPPRSVFFSLSCFVLFVALHECIMKA